jgi:hypothetical protein
MLETSMTNARRTERFGDQHRASITSLISSGTAKNYRSPIVQHADNAT